MWLLYHMNPEIYRLRINDLVGAVIDRPRKCTEFQHKFTLNGTFSPKEIRIGHLSLPGAQWAPLRSAASVIRKFEGDCHTSDIGLLFAMTGDSMAHYRLAKLHFICLLRKADRINLENTQRSEKTAYRQSRPFTSGFICMLFTHRKDAEEKRPASFACIWQKWFCRIKENALPMGQKNDSVCFLTYQAKPL